VGRMSNEKNHEKNHEGIRKKVSITSFHLSCVYTHEKNEKNVHWYTESHIGNRLMTISRRENQNENQ
jgi:hypothetical protein